MKNKVYNTLNIHLKGIMTKKMLESLNISMENTTKHGVIKLPYGTCDLYEAPAPYDAIDIIYGEISLLNSVVIPPYYFYEHEIEKYHLTPIGKNELPTIVCTWNFFKIGETNFEKIGTVNYVYNRKKEEKYRLRFLTDPTFDPREWEAKRDLQNNLIK